MRGFVNAYPWSVVVALLFLPLATSAARELDLEVGVSANYNKRDSSTSNRNDRDEPSVRISPSVRLEEHEGNFQWRFGYKPSYEQFLQTTELNRWTHLVDGSLSWQINPTTSLSLSDHFGYYNSVSRFNEEVSEGEIDAVSDVTEGFRDNEYIRNSINASLTHSLSPTRRLVFRLGHNLTDRSGGSSRLRSSRQQMLSTAGHYTHTVSQRNTLGGGISFRRSVNDGTAARGDQSTDFWNLFGSWNHRFDETLGLSVMFGPTWVQAGDQDDFVQILENRPLYPVFEDKLLRADTCPTTDDGTPYYAFLTDCDPVDVDLTEEDQAILNSFRTDLEFEGSVPSGSSGSLTYFANVLLSKRWKYWSGTLSYNRQENDSLGVGTSTVADVVTGALEWKPSLRWSSNLRVAFTRYTSATDLSRAVVTVEPEPAFEGTILEGAARNTAFTALEVDQDAFVDNLSLSLRVSYRLTKRATLSSSVSYWSRSTGGGVDVERDYERISVYLGVRYSFDPIPF